jgi:hypothetical protein
MPGQRCPAEDTTHTAVDQTHQTLGQVAPDAGRPFQYSRVPDAMSFETSSRSLETNGPISISIKAPETGNLDFTDRRESARVLVFSTRQRSGLEPRLRSAFQGPCKRLSPDLLPFFEPPRL